MENRPTQDLLLPSGIKVVFYSNLTTGDLRKIRRVSYAGLKLVIDPANPKKEAQVQEISGEFMVDSEEVTLHCLIKEIYMANGTKVEEGKLTDFIYNLPETEGNLIYAKSEEISGGSALTHLQKKTD